MSSDSSAHPLKNRRKPRKKKAQLLSREDTIKQIISLMEQADETIRTDNDLAQKLANQARKLQMRTRVQFPAEWKRRFCKHCKSFLYPGKNCRIRLSSSNKVVAILCYNCNRHSRIPYYKRKEDINEGRH
jgi:ribonuclease P protein subunit RPR2